MKITKEQLQQIIKEELSSVLKESSVEDDLHDISQYMDDLGIYNKKDGIKRWIASRADWKFVSPEREKELLATLSASELSQQF
tara:strand:- start:288 stop:536 length:249 start_codon:yes stop_codon:yes gene_type:complete